MKTLGFKIFFIGFNKCATRSLSEWLRQAGVDSIHGGLDGDGYHDKLLRNVSHGWPTLQGFDDHDAYLDIDAVRKCFRELDRDYPGSDFIVHHKLVTDHFANRPNDFLRFDVEKDRPRDLATFLGLDAAALPDELPREGETSSVKHYDFSGGKIVRVVEIEAAVAERDRANEMLQSVIAERESAIAQIHAANAQIERVTLERDRALASRDALFAQRGQLISERDALARSCEAVTAEFEAIRRSRSWRITAPLRELRGWLARPAAVEGDQHSPSTTRVVGQRPPADRP